MSENEIDSTARTPENVSNHPAIPKPLKPVDIKSAVLIVVAAILLDVAVTVGTFGLASAIALSFVPLAVLIAGRVENLSARVGALIGPLFAFFLCWRSSPWLVAMNVLGVATLVTIASLWSRGPNIFQTSIPNAFARCFTYLDHFFSTPMFLLAPILKLVGQLRQQRVVSCWVWRWPCQL